jgi:hypothetical protein
VAAVDHTDEQPPDEQPPDEGGAVDPRRAAPHRLPSSARRLLDDVHQRRVNFDVDRRHELTEATGWRVDDYCQPLPPEPPGPPEAAGTWQIACDLLRGYEFADPRIVPAVYHHDGPLEDRDMVLEARFLVLRFHLGVRVGGVNDRLTGVDGRPVRLWGWNYRTLEGHLEMGQMDYEVWKWLDTGEVDFRIHVVSRAARIRNPVVRLGFHLFGRPMQVRFARAALARMRQLVTARLLAHRAGIPVPEPAHTLDRIVVERT